mmetsp:Transcript_4526/g.6063  ORF Transcript_4526/g.6063 Transcript_4526/m.6063 type:complete len:173 (+) Transcript_4526:273-791(+)
MTDSEGRTFLYRCCQYSHWDTFFQVLSLKNGSLDVNIPDQSGWNPLLFCVRYGNLPAMTKLLYTPGIDINYRMADGWNSVLLAAAYGHLEVLKLLVNHGGASLDIDVRYNGFSPRDVAHINGKAETAAYLTLLGSRPGKRTMPYIRFEDRGEDDKQQLRDFLSSNTPYREPK